MAGPSNQKIDELRLRLKADPKSRLFYPLAEELRKISQHTEAEQVLRTGLTHHPTYLSAWVSLGRVLREVGKNTEASESLSKALQLDPGNVVAARLLADAYLALGEKVEAIKKYKLVHALLPSDEQIVETINRLDAELNPPPPVPVAEAEPEPAPGPEPVPEPEQVPELAPGSEPSSVPAVGISMSGAGTFVAASEPEPSPFFMEETPVAEPEPEAVPFSVLEAPEPEREEHPVAEPATAEEEPLAVTSMSVDHAVAIDESPFASDDAEILAAAEHTFADEQESAVRTGDDEPMYTAHAESPFEEPASGFSGDSLDVEAPLGMHIEEAPLAAEVPAPMQAFEEPAEYGFTPTLATPFSMDETPAPEVSPEELTETVTMADLYARQGLTGNAREIYEHILQRDPNNEAVRAKLDALGSAPAQPRQAEAPQPEPAGNRDARVERLENWLARVGRKEVSHV